MPGLVPGIHVLCAAWIGVDGRDKPGHDGCGDSRCPGHISYAPPGGGIVIPPLNALLTITGASLEPSRFEG
ncbi:hypothetical protein ABIG06_002335 [Bradyrhizobium sp. USDA 326]